MVRYSRVRVGSRILLLLLLVLVLFFFGLWWFDQLNILNAKNFFAPVFKLVGLKTTTPLESKDSPYLLEEERLKKQEQALLIWQEENENREKELLDKEAELTQMMNAVKEKEEALNEKEKSFNDRVNLYEDKSKRLRQVSLFLTSMPPDEAVAHLANMADQDIVDLLRVTDLVAGENEQLSMVSVWLAGLDPERAAAIERKMIKKPNDPVLSVE
ncbi:MAG: flagellar protein FlbB [Spirochaetales bacterium]|nr:flagellar protein FlbB [Spirochaetales bacterium]